MTLAPFVGDLGWWIGGVFTAAITALRIATAKRITVTSDSFTAGKILIPRSALGKATLIAKDDQFAARGALLDARAFLILKSGLKDMVRIEITDKKDPTPYILVSTRRGSELVSALNAK